MSWDGYNAYADLVFGISTQGSRERNLSRGIGINNAIDMVVNGNGVTRTEVATQVVSTVVASVLMGKVVGNVVSGIKGISTSGFFRGESVPIKALPSPRQFLLDRVQNPKLVNMVKYLYRERATVGNGGTADVVRHELSTGELYSKNGHIQKAVQARLALKRMIDSGVLNENDLQIAQSLRQNLHKALIEQEWNIVSPNRLQMKR